MTELLYHEDSYLKEFSARVVKHVEAGVVLDKTALYVGGGGQPCDAGTLVANESQWDVPELQWVNGKAVHVIADEPPPIGANVHGLVEWRRRYALMRAHTAMHILCGVVWRDYGAQVTGGNMQPGQGRLDFEFERFDASLVAEIEKKINIEVEAQRDVRVAVLPRAEAFAIPDLIRTKINLLPKHIEAVRTVEIVGLDLQADGGTHVANTEEVGPLRIVSHKSKGRINKRIVVALED